MGNNSTSTAKYEDATLIGFGMAFKQISVGDMHSCGVTPSGQAVCWGDNTQGQLGTGNIIDAKTPQNVVGGIDFVQVSVNRRSSNADYFTCGVASNGSAYCCKYLTPYVAPPLCCGTYTETDQPTLHAYMRRRQGGTTTEG